MADIPFAQVVKCDNDSYFVPAKCDNDSYFVPASRRSMADQIDVVKNMGLPLGIAEQFVKSTQEFARRYWIIDNSGSMGSADGHRIVQGPGGREGMVTCSRWEELGAAIGWHARLAVELGAPTEFRLLNQPGGGGPQMVSVGSTDGSYDAASEAELRLIERLVYSEPTGRTPLCEQIRRVIAEISADAAQLRANGQRACVVIASDGKATDGDIATALKPMRSLPVWIVVRLCTDDDRVVEYWNNVDDELELDMDVLDDLCGEAAEVNSYQPWLTYAAPLHRLREWGSSVKLFDLIDERPFALHEISEMCALLFGGAAKDLPHPQIDWKGFIKRISEIQSASGEVWDPARSRRRPWISINKLKKALHKGACTIL